VGSSTGSILYYSETKNWLNGSSNLVYGAGGFNYSPADRDYADAYTRYSYRFYEAEVQLQVKLINRDAPLGVDSDFTYDGLGRLSNVSVGGPRSHVLNYVNDINGQVISRTLTRTASGIPGSANPVQYYHYYNGIMLGSNGNNGNDRPDMQTALNERIAQGPTTPGVFRNGGTGPNPYADFDQAYDAVSPETLSQGPSAYTVRSGDSLESIAAQIWGDASLWYMIAEANPSAARGALNAGTSLIIPNKVANFHNTSDTFRPYDAEKAIGDTQPGTPKPPKANKGCGVVGFILLAVIAIAVTVVTAGAAVAALAPATTSLGTGIATVLGTAGALTGGVAGVAGAAGAIAIGAGSAIIGSIVSQGFGVATGLQDKFSWKGVALAGLSAGIGAGLDQLGAFAQLGIAGTQGARGVFNAVVRAAITSTVTQGVAVATKLQDKFSFTSVAAAGVAAGVAAVVSQNIGGAAKYNDAGELTARASGINRLISGVAGSIAGGATRSAIDGTNFGDNIIATLPDVIASLFNYGLEELSGGDPNNAGLAMANHEDSHVADTPQPGTNDSSSAQATTDVAGAVTTADQSDLIPGALAGLDFGPFRGIAIDPDTAILTPAERTAKAERTAQAEAPYGGGSGSDAGGVSLQDQRTPYDLRVPTDGVLLSTTIFESLDNDGIDPILLSEELARDYRFLDANGQINRDGLLNFGYTLLDEITNDRSIYPRVDQVLGQFAAGPNLGEYYGGLRTGLAGAYRDLPPQLSETDAFFAQLEENIPLIYNSAKSTWMGTSILIGSTTGLYDVSPEYVLEFLQANERVGQSWDGISGGLARTRDDLITTSTFGMRPWDWNSRGWNEYTSALGRHGDRGWGIVSAPFKAAARFGDGLGNVLASGIVNTPDGTLGRGLANMVSGGGELAAMAVPISRIGGRSVGASANVVDNLGRVDNATITAPLLLPAPNRVRLPQDIAASPNAPVALNVRGRTVGGSAAQNAALRADIRAAKLDGGRNFRVNQQQVNAAGQRVGINRPDLQYTRLDGKRMYIEYDNRTPGTFPNTPRGPAHLERILANDPNGLVELRSF
jgi:LysM domain